MEPLDPKEGLHIPNEQLAESNPKFAEEELIQLLSEKVARYLEFQPDLLMSYLYRLDVTEASIHKALSNQSEEPGHVLLARLIWKRQKQRFETKQKYKSNGNVESWDEF